LEELKCTCNRCGHEWQKRLEKEPVACPKCKNTLWNIPRKYRVKSKED